MRRKIVIALVLLLACSAAGAGMAILYIRATTSSLRQLVRLHQIQELRRDLVIATHGRSLYILDDVRPLRELTPAVWGKEAHLFSIRPAHGRYLATVKQVDFILLDHISIVTSGLESSDEGERKDIDILMTRLRSLIEETGVGVIAIVHLKRAQKKDYYSGDAVALSDLRGSGSLEQLSDNVIAIERDQQGSDPTKMTVRVLKCRETGETGPADLLDYNRQTGRIEVVGEVKFEDSLDAPTR